MIIDYWKMPGGIAALRRNRALGVGVLLGTITLSGCATEESPTVNTRTQAVTEADTCGLQVAAELVTVKGNGGYRAQVTLTNASGEAATEFEVLLDLGDSTIANGQQAVYSQVEDGYLVTAPGMLGSNPLEVGDSFTFKFNGEGSYETLKAYLISVNGTPCDTTTPDVTLTVNSLVTSAGPVTLTAETDDNVAVRKVVFEKDGTVIGEDSDAPFSIDVDLGAEDNGLRLFSATAVDYGGNQGAASDRTVVAIDNRFFGTAPAGENTYAGILDHFNQITPENAGKWDSIESTRDEMNWDALDTAYNFAKDNGLPFKFHTLVWGNQAPGWLPALSQEEQVEELEEFMAAVAERYPHIDMIDVVNEPLHAPPSYVEGLGGAGETGWDWVLKSFEMARGYFPNSILLVNDYNIIILPQLTASYMPVIEALNERGLVDGIGVQGHFLEQADPTVVATNLETLASTGLGIYVSEFDISYADDARQANVYRSLVTTFLDNPSVLGITSWGHLKGAIWRQDAWLVDGEGNTRPALDWLTCTLGGGALCPVPEYVPQPVVGDETGLIVEVEQYQEAEGLIGIEGAVGYNSDGSWLRMDRVVFDSNWDTVAVTYSKGNNEPASISLYFDSLDSTPVASIALPSTGSWGGNDTVSVPWGAISGERNLFVKFNGQNGVANLDKLKFSAPEALGANIIDGGDFEGETTTWFSWGSPAPTIEITQDRALAGAKSLRLSDRSSNNPAATDVTAQVVPGTTYKTSFWVSIDGAESASVNVTKKIQCAGEGAEYTWLGQVTVSGSDWAEIAGDVIIPDCDIEQVQLWAEGPGAGIDLYVDHVSMRPEISDDRINIISPSNFENGTLGSWHTWNDGTIAVTDQVAHTGERSLIVTNRLANAPAAYDVGALVPGETYAASFWVSIVGAPSAKVNVTQAITCDGNTSYTWLAQVPVAENAWAEIAGDIVMPNCDSVSLKLWAEGDTGVDLLVDDVSLLAPPATPSEPEGNLVTGTFEDGSAGWYTWGNPMEVTDEEAHTGDYSLKVTGSGVGKAVLQMNGILVPGATYELSYWVNLAGADAADIHVTNTADCGEGGQYHWVTNSATVQAGSWVNLTGTYTIADDCTLADAQFYVEGGNIQNSSGTVSLYVDDVVITQKQQIVTVLANDFESNMDGWYSWGAPIGLTADIAHNGVQSLAVTGEGGKAVLQMNSLLSPNDTYDVSYWVTIAGADSANMHVTNTADCGEGAQYVWITGNPVVTAGTWTELTGSYTVPEGCTLVDQQFYVEAGSVVNPSGNVTLYVDDVVITK